MLTILLISSISIYIAAKLLPGIEIKSFWSAVIVAIVLALVNTFIKPIAVLISLPLTIVTLGLFLLAINAFMILIVDAFVDGFKVKNFWWALGFSFVVGFINWILSAIFS